MSNAINQGSCPGKERMNNETTDGGATIPCISLLDRWRYIKTDPHGARALLLLLEHGKGTSDDFDTMVDRIILSMVGEGLFKLSNATADRASVADTVKPVVGKVSRKSLNILAADDYEEYGDDPM